LEYEALKVDFYDSVEHFNIKLKKLPCLPHVSGKSKTFLLVPMIHIHPSKQKSKQTKQKAEIFLPFCPTGSSGPSADAASRVVRQAVPLAALPVAVAEDPLLRHPDGECDRVTSFLKVSRAGLGSKPGIF
jgi:hypothetical protein